MPYCDIHEKNIKGKTYKVGNEYVAMNICTVCHAKAQRQTRLHERYLAVMLKATNNAKKG